MPSMDEVAAPAAPAAALVQRMVGLGLGLGYFFLYEFLNEVPTFSIFPESLTLAARSVGSVLRAEYSPLCWLR